MSSPSSPPSSIQISTRAFVQSLLILLALMILAGVLTRVVPPGAYSRLEQDGREVILPGSYQPIPAPDYPVWRWFTAPIEVLGAPGSLIIIVIIIFLLMVGAAFTVLDQSGLLQAILSRLVRAFGGRKYLLLLVVSFFFMSLGAFFGIIEEIIPLVPLTVALAYFLGWDALVGLGMSILAANMGFSAAITNPFTIGVAQKIAGLPLFSGAWLRIIIFIVVYIVFAIFLTRYAKKIERRPQDSPIYKEDQAARAARPAFDLHELAPIHDSAMRRALTWLLVFLLVIFISLFAGPFLPAISDYILPLVGVLFLIAGLGAGLLSGAAPGAVARSAWRGVLSIAPAIPLILMAVSVRHIVASGAILDTLLYRASQSFTSASPFIATVSVYFLALLIEFFIASGSAKAFLIMPIILPLGDLVGVTRQVIVTAYCFGDGFSNMAYPTSAMLLISLGLTVVSYPKWLRWTLPLWLAILLVTLVFLAIAIAINYGPF